MRAVKTLGVLAVTTCAALTGGAGCASIIGVEDFTPGSEAGAADGTTGSDGAEGAVGNDSTMGDDDAPSESGESGAESAASESGGNDGTAPGDAAPETSPQMDASPDAGSDASVHDAGTDAPVDSGVDSYVCTPLTPAEACTGDAGLNCGIMVSDGCNGMISCTCTSPEVCAQAGTASVCCTPLTQAQACGDAGLSCGAVPDGCQGMVSCGTCTLPEVCGGAGAANVCGDPDAGCVITLTRYTVIDDGNGISGSGTGKVYDSTTGKTWMRFQYFDSLSTNGGEPQMSADCMTFGMRIPTETEALAISGANFDPCAWPGAGGWTTWTSTMPGGFPPSYDDVSSGGSIQQAYLSNYQDVLCVTP
jgi:hypothetical protein